MPWEWGTASVKDAVGTCGWDSVLLVQICGLLCSNSSEPGGPISEQSHWDDPTLPWLFQPHLPPYPISPHITFCMPQQGSSLLHGLTAGTGPGHRIPKMLLANILTISYRALKDCYTSLAKQMSLSKESCIWCAHWKALCFWNGLWL